MLRNITAVDSGIRYTCERNHFKNLKLSSTHSKCCLERRIWFLLASRCRENICFPLGRFERFKRSCDGLLLFSVFNFSNDCKIDARAPIHQMVDETKKGSVGPFDPIDLDDCRRYLAVSSVDDFQFPFRRIDASAPKHDGSCK